MTTATFTQEKPFRDYTATIKSLIIAVVVMSFTAGLMWLDTDYTRKTQLVGTVVAKTQLPAAKSATDGFILAMRDHAGTLHNIRTDFARYATTPVGAIVAAETSPKDEGLPRPWLDAIRDMFVVILIICSFCAIWTFCWAWINSDLPPTSN